jgi:TolB protein
MIADAIYSRLTGEKGFFDTRVVFVDEQGSKDKRIKRLAIMDQDGANPSYLSDGGFIAMTPRFSSNTQQITYAALRADSSHIYLFNIKTARHEVLGSSGGMMFAPRFSPDGLKVVYSLSRNGNTDVFVQDLRSGAQSRLTDDPSIDTSPSYSPDGSRIVFNSDRGGSPQLYVMDADGGNQRRISFGSGRYTTPVWSPRGDLIAFTKQEGSQFHIGVMKPDGSGERILTTSYLDEGPTWAPNGRVLMFSRETRGGAPKLGPWRGLAHALFSTGVGTPASLRPAALAMAGTAVTYALIQGPAAALRGDGGIAGGEVGVRTRLAAV